jgi:hypothetical protein
MPAVGRRDGHIPGEPTGAPHGGGLRRQPSFSLRGLTERAGDSDSCGLVPSIDRCATALRLWHVYIERPPPMNDEHDSPELDRFAEIIRKLQAHDPSGMDDLRTMFDRGLRLLLVRRGVQDTDRASGVILSRAAELVRRRVPFDPARLPAQLRAALNEICPPNGRAPMGTQSAETADAREVLASLEGSEREALLRFYVREQRPAQICVDLGFTECAFSTLKSRVRAKYFELTRGQLTRGPVISR